MFEMTGIYLPGLTVWTTALQGLIWGHKKVFLITVAAQRWAQVARARGLQPQPPPTARHSCPSQLHGPSSSRPELALNPPASRAQLSLGSVSPHFPSLPLARPARALMGAFSGAQSLKETGGIHCPSPAPMHSSPFFGQSDESSVLSHCCRQSKESKTHQVEGTGSTV